MTVWVIAQLSSHPVLFNFTTEFSGFTAKEKSKSIVILESLLLEIQKLLGSEPELCNWAKANVWLPKKRLKQRIEFCIFHLSLG